MLHLWKSSRAAPHPGASTQAGSAAKPGNTASHFRLGVLPSAFNPVTIAHLELAHQAIRQYSLDEVLFLLPRVFPHKAYARPSFEQRLEMLLGAVAGASQFSAGSTDQGLFIDIVRETQGLYGPQTEFFLICGRDAADRAVNWDYGFELPFAEQLKDFQMLVAPRGGLWAPPPEYAARIHQLDLPPELQLCSSSAVRDAIAAGQNWEHLVPAPAAEIIRRRQLYLRSKLSS